MQELIMSKKINPVTESNATNALDKTSKTTSDTDLLTNIILQNEENINQNKNSNQGSYSMQEIIMTILCNVK